MNWAQASVEGAELTVSLEGELPSGWKKSFEKTVRLLGGGEWGDVELKKRTVRVGNVAPGNEDKLRHYLEGVVAQANAAHRDDEDGPTRAREEREPSRDGPDAQMTERFRAFADQDSDDDGD